MIDTPYVYFVVLYFTWFNLDTYTVMTMRDVDVHYKAEVTDRFTRVLADLVIDHAERHVRSRFHQPCHGCP